MLRVRVPSNARERLEADAAAVLAQLQKQALELPVAVQHEQQEEQQWLAQQQQQQWLAVQAAAQEQQQWQQWQLGSPVNQQQPNHAQQQQQPGLPPALQQIADSQARRLVEYHTQQQVLAKAAKATQREADSGASSPTIQAYYAEPSPVGSRWA